MADSKDGIAAALEAVGTDGELVDEAEQLPLLPLDQPSEARPDGRPAAMPRRGPGRPPGASNKRTQQLAEFLTTQYRHPLIALCEAFSMPVEDLAKRLSCDKVEAFKLQLSAAERVAPYVAQKMPQGLQVDTRGSMKLEIVLGKETAEADQGAGVVIVGEHEEIEENQ